MRYLTILSVILVMLGVGVGAEGGIIWDYSPSVYGISTASYSNRITSQHFAEKVYFDSDTLVAGMDIYTGATMAQVGDLVTISLWADVSGNPGSPLASFTEPLSAIESVSGLPGIYQLHADFGTSLSLAASTDYWVGMSGTSKDIGQAALSAIPPGADDMAALFSGTTSYGKVSVGDLAFRLHGGSSPEPVPEPSSLAILGVGAVGFANCAWRCRRKAVGK